MAAAARASGKASIAAARYAIPPHKKAQRASNAPQLLRWTSCRLFFRMSAEAGQLAAGDGGGDADSQIQDLKKRIRSFDMMYARHQQEGKSFEALEFLEKGLFLRKELLGAEHPEVSKVCQVT